MILDNNRKKFQLLYYTSLWLFFLILSKVQVIFIMLNSKYTNKFFNFVIYWSNGRTFMLRICAIKMANNKCWTNIIVNWIISYTVSQIISGWCMSFSSGSWVISMSWAIYMRSWIVSCWIWIRGMRISIS